MDALARIRSAADESVRRGCGFAVLAIGSVMAGLAFDAYMAAKAGAILASLMTAVLHGRAWKAPSVPFKRTELFGMLDRSLGVPQQFAQQIVGTALQDAYRRHANLSMIGAGVLWLITLLLGLVRLFLA
jgi:hypothetical protein